ncbi:sensor histidine kinase [Hominibacterium faecale]|uniref:sensor histidine kinase n=1 Tax=Hominibacterium faecale TaxID=2839743 RepID=UPI0022B29B2C|nr:HAMP domain-containing sensor histidine kinase [Hominibacterium faecale]
MSALPAVLLLAIGILVILVLFLWRDRNQWKKALHQILRRLDLAISGTEQETAYDESLDSAITEKLNQLIVITKMNCEDAQRDKNLVKGLLSDISHQVRTPLTNIMLYAGILKENCHTDDNKKMAEQIQQQSEKLNFFMKELVRSSYLETEMISAEVERNSIDQLIGQACQSIELSALKKHIVLEIEECGKYGWFDLKWTREALVNVLDNGVKYSPEGSVIKVATEFYDSFFCIKVADQGIGIEEKEQGAIFQRFYRSPRVAKEQGLGIGLYLAREIVEKQNGYMKVQSALGEGTTFYIFLPYHKT